MKSGTRGSRFFVKIAITMVAVILGLSLSANGNSYSLINDQLVDESLSIQMSNPPAHFPSAWRSRPVILNPVIASSDTVAVGDVISLNLFADVLLSASVDRVSTNVNGTVTIRCRIEDYPLGDVIISTTDHNSLASINIP